MPVYLFEASDGEQIEVSLPWTDERREIRQNGKRYRKIIAPVAIHAYTPVGAEADKIAHRHYRVNKEVAEGLADGSMRPPDDRDVGGDKQPRSSVAQFNRMYADAKERAGKPLVK